MKSKHCLYAFLAKDKMFKIEMTGSNMNDGLIIDYYCTRKMVIKHWYDYHERLTAPEFRHLYKSLTDAVLQKMI